MIRSTALLLLGVMAALLPLAAEPLERPDLRERVDSAGVIVHATVTDTHAEWIDDERGRNIWTTATLTPHAVLKGALAKGPLQIRFIGGIVGDIGQAATHSFHVDRGEEIILFLEADTLEPLGGPEAAIRVFDGRVFQKHRAFSREAFLDRIRNLVSPAPTDTPSTGTLTIPQFPKTGASEGENKATEPNLTWYTPGGWSDAIVTSIVTGTTTDDVITELDSIYVDWAIANFGDAAAGPFAVELYLNGSFEARWTAGSGLAAMTYTYLSDYSLGTLAVGDHTLELRIDPDGAVAESNEGDNIYTKDFTVQDSGLTPAISALLPGEVPAGTDTAITIVGQRFGATQGTGTVEFFYRSGQPLIAGTILSWSDTRIRCVVPVGTVNGYSASAATGPLKVTNNSGYSANYNYFRSIFGNGRKQWPGSPATVNYRINENCGETTGEGAAVQAAAATWNAVGTDFTFSYAGTCSATFPSNNGVNEIGWGDTGGSLATTYYWYYPASGNIFETDMIFNDADFTWNTSGSPPAGTHDVQTIALHEFGHYLNLRDLYGNVDPVVNDTAKVMYGFSSAGTVERTLTHADILGIRHIYQPYGDADASDSVDTTDQALLADYLAGNIDAGQNGFTQPVNADVDAGDNWQARDLTIFICHLNSLLSRLPFY